MDNDSEPLSLNCRKNSLASVTSKADVKSEGSMSLMSGDVFGAMSAVDNALLNPFNPFPPSMKDWEI